MVAAVASYLDARAHGGTWLVRIEDVDEGRSVPGVAEGMLELLGRCGMHPDGEVVWQSRRTALYEEAARSLGPRVYPCGCNRREIADSRLGLGPDGAAIYPGTCRNGLPPGKTMRSLRLRVPDPGAPGELLQFTDRWHGPVEQHLASQSGDFVLLRGDGFWAYQLAVVVDDALQGVTDVVRGADLLDSTPRQIYLQQQLGVPTPRYLHVPVVRNANGEKLSKQTGAGAIVVHSEAEAIAVLVDAAKALGLSIDRTGSTAEFWQRSIAEWSVRHQKLTRR
jgi:glutamyl-Q tRNA(Asp) synthetase